MGKYIVEISDENGLSCRVHLNLPLYKKTARTDNSTWRVLDEGFLKFRSGGCHMTSQTGNERMATAIGYLKLCSGKYWGVVLNEFVDGWGIANDSGDGELVQPWVINAKPGTITWTLLE